MGLWRVLSDLEEDGYRTEWGLYSAEETGAPHQRIRMFILAKLPDTSGEGLQGDKLRGSCDEQVKGLQGSYKPTSELHQVRDEQLAHTASREPRQSQARNGGQDSSRGSEDTRWPARPGEEQYDWEEPRTLKSCVGLSANGDSTRVDELRLLGNGVVPQTAELAWKSLWSKIDG